MTTTIYKKLFEIQIFHDYFLSTVSGDPISSFEPEDKRGFLKDVLKYRRYDVHHFLKIEPSIEMKTMLKNYRMRMIPTPLGFFVGMEVKQIQTGSTLYEPFISLSNKAPMSFLIKPNDDYFHNYSNLPLQDLLPARYYFTNQFVAGEKSADLKVLSALIPPKNATAKYEMGTLVKDGDKIQEAYTDLDGAPNFLNIAGDGFVTGRDRVLLPKRFNYDLGQQVTEEVVFSLINAGTSIKTISKAADKPIRFVHLDFEKQNNEAKTPIPDGVYTLQVSGSPVDQKVVLNNTLYDKNALGAIEIFPFAGSPEFDLLDNQGRLHARIDANGIKKSHPIFELRFASRKAYWRYNSEEKIDQAIIDEYQGFLQEPDGTKKVLVSTIPRSFSLVVRHFNDTPLIPPQPSPYALRWEAGRYLTDIHLSSIAQFK